MPEGMVDAGGVRLWYETFGDVRDPTILLIMGLGAQAISWSPEFCGKLVAAGYHVIRYDNRDVGRSQYFDDTSDPYSLDDLARDAVALLDGLGVDAAHIVGASMGGMIAQLVALDFPERVLSLTSIMSSPGGPGEPPSPEVTAALVQPPGRTHEERVDAAIRNRRLLAAGGFPQDDAHRVATATAAVERAFHPAGTMRQAYALATAPPRGERLASLTVPTLVVHGTADNLVPFSHGVATAKAIPGAALHSVEGLGHELPPSVWDDVAGAITAHIQGVRP